MKFFASVLMICLIPLACRAGYIYSVCGEIVRAVTRSDLPAHSLLNTIAPLQKGSKYPVRGMALIYHLADNILPVRYVLTQQSREPYRHGVIDGLVYDSRGRLADTGGEEFMYVMDKAGNIYINPESRFRFQHSSFVRNVAAAGLIDISHGRILHISRSSGHFRPSIENLQSFLAELQERNADLSGATVDSSDFK